MLTATPLQNSLLELFGLVSFIDEHTFGDLKSFREQFANLSQEQVFQTLKTRLKPICHRTLRRQVTSYIPFTKRLAIGRGVHAGGKRRSALQSRFGISPPRQSPGVARQPAIADDAGPAKLLASSTFAIAGALDIHFQSPQGQARKQEPGRSLEDELDKDYEALDETAEEWTEDATGNETLSDADRAAIEAEVADLDSSPTWPCPSTHNAKGKALLKALNIAFAKAAEIGAAQKAIIFTESRRTQNYLLRVLADSEFREGIVLFNGSNTDDRSKAIYAAWLETNTPARIASPAPNPPTCVPRWWIISAKKAGS